MAESQIDLLELTTPLDPLQYQFKILRFKGEEEISQGFEYRITFSSLRWDVNPKELLGKCIGVSLFLNGEEKRYFHGIATRFLGGRFLENKYARYDLVIEPWFASLKNTKVRRIFENMDSIEIIQQIFKELSYSNFKFSTIQTYQKREYCVCYDESLWHFISRLLEEEGIFYFYNHQKEGSKMIFKELSSSLNNCPNFGTAKVLQAKGNWEDPEQINSFEYDEQIVANQYSSGGYDYQKPTLPTGVKITLDSDSDVVLPYQEYALEKNDNQRVGHLGMVQAKAIQAEKIRVRGTSTCRAFTVGYSFELKGHFQKSLNTKYILRKISFEADEQTGYSNHFEAFPANVLYHPSKKVGKPKVYGAQTAVVIGRGNDDQVIYTDQLGRIRLRFHWIPQKEKENWMSCWVRVTQVGGGTNMGAMFIPRVGTEVLVTFVEGDPDQPLVIGGLYNEKDQPPFDLPHNDLVSGFQSRTPGRETGNELKFVDTPDKQQLYFRAEKDQKTVVKNKKYTFINTDEGILEAIEAKKEEIRKLSL